MLTNEGKWGGRVEFDCDLFVIGFRDLLGDNAIDYPKRNLLYNNWTDKDKLKMYGRGFTVLSQPLRDVADRSITGRFDFVIYLGPRCLRYPEHHGLAGGTFYEARHDARTVHKSCTSLPMKISGQTLEESPIFRFSPGGKVVNLFAEHPAWTALPLGIPRRAVMPIHFNRSQIHPTVMPVEHGGASKYVHSTEKSYYAELNRCWFGPTCRKQRWDALRHYEILAAGACLVFKNYDKKPPRTAPAELPCFSVKHWAEINELRARLIKNDKPTQEYIDMVYRQRVWLLENTADKVAARLLERIG